MSNDEVLPSPRLLERALGVRMRMPLIGTLDACEKAMDNRRKIDASYAKANPIRAGWAADAINNSIQHAEQQQREEYADTEASTSGPSSQATSPNSSHRGDDSRAKFRSRGGAPPAKVMPKQSL